MTTREKIAANRRNAKTSTGPKSSLGKSRAKKNAYRHGLSLPVVGDPSRLAEIEHLAIKIAGEKAEPHVFEQARHIASAQIDLVRVRRARLRLISKVVSGEYRPETFFKDVRYLITEADRLLRLSGGQPVTPAEPSAKLHDQVWYWLHQSPEKVSNVLSELTHQLTATDRYERRARSRRKFAIRAFDLETR